MSDYTLTTEDIREEFIEAFQVNSLPLEFSSKFLIDKFDRWLAQHDAEIVKQTKERIIALLDQKHTAHEGDKTHNDSGECLSCEVIALTKGETK